MSPKKLSVLLDLSVRRESVLTQPVLVEKTIVWGNLTQTIPVESWERRPCPPPDQEWRRKQKEYLPTISQLAREGMISCYSYSELRFEEMRGRPGMMGTFGDLFAGIDIKKCAPAIERSRFRQSADFAKFLRKEDLVEFCKFLLTLDTSALMQVPQFWNRIPTFEQSNLIQVERFKLLCRHLTSNHYPDAFHLWTAEVNGLDYFLMMERAFPNALRGNRDFDFRCKPISPVDLVGAFANK